MSNSTTVKELRRKLGYVMVLEKVDPKTMARFKRNRITRSNKLPMDELSGHDGKLAFNPNKHKRLKSASKVAAGLAGVTALAAGARYLHNKKKEK